MDYRDERRLRPLLQMNRSDLFPKCTQRLYEQMTRLSPAPLSDDLLVVLALRIEDSGEKPTFVETAEQRQAQAAKKPEPTKAGEKQTGEKQPA